MCWLLSKHWAMNCLTFVHPSIRPRWQNCRLYFFYKSWTASQRTALIEERNRRIIEHYLRAWNTQESIGEIFGLDRTVISKLIDVQIAKSVEMHTDFKPFIYNIWNTPRQDHETNHFGSFPQVFMENQPHTLTERHRMR